MTVSEAEAPPDRQTLLTAALAGDAHSRAELVRAVWPDAYRIAWTILRNHVAAEDSAQDACAAVYGALADLRAPAAFRTWFYRIVVRCALRYRATPLEAPPAAAAAPASVEDRLDVAGAVLALPRDLRVAVVLRYYTGLNASEIAQVTGVPAGTVRFRLAMARRRLATRLKGEDRA